MINPNDLKVLRELAEWKALCAASAVNREKIDAWYAHDAGEATGRVMVLAEVDYLQDKRRTITEQDLQCVDPWARGVERGLRLLKYQVEVLKDDHVASPYIDFTPFVSCSDFGIPSGKRYEAGGAQDSFHYVAPLQTLDEAELARLRHRTFTWDREAEDAHRGRLESVFAGILQPRRRTGPWQFHMPLTSTAIEMVGLDNLMVLMYDNPQGLHRLMAFLRDDMVAYTQFLEHSGLLDANNEDDYVGAGSMGFTRSLPNPCSGDRLCAGDRWYGMESQESVGISPDQFGEFVFPYMKAISQQYGRVYYGCCEPAHPILDYLKTLPNLARVSVSPWADELKVGDFCRQSGVVYSRKPTPNILSAEHFDENAQRAHLQATIEAAHGCRLEFIQRDVYTTNNQPERFVRWVELVREVAQKHTCSCRIVNQLPDC